MHGVRESDGSACRTEDADTIQAFFHGLSPASRRNRFLGALNEVPATELYNMTHSNHGSHPLLIAEHIDDGFCKMIAEARYATAPAKLECEFAVSVAELGDAGRSARV
jgi:hypothetical protein